MALEKLQKLEEALALYSGRCRKIEAERDRFRDELKALKEENLKLSRGKEEAKKRVDALLRRLGDVGD